MPVQTNTYRKNLLQCYNHLTAAVADRDRQTMRIVSSTDVIGLQIIDTSNIHLTHLAIHIIVITIRLMDTHRITLLTLTCIKMRTEFTKVLTRESAILLIFEMLTIAKGKC